jgi:PhzF family phenazine biosynthesis protein
MSLSFTVVDAFTDKAFGGNPAAVIVLPSDHEYQTSTLQSIALEFNLSETAFVTVDKQLKFDSTQNYVSFGLRWFTPTDEVKLCGHATLASALVLYANPELVPEHINEIRFSTLSGILAARRLSDSSKIELEFPVGNIFAPDEGTRTEAIEMVRAATGIHNLVVTYVGVCSAQPYSGYLLVELDSSVDLPSLKVNSGSLVRVASSANPGFRS